MIGRLHGKLIYKQPPFLMLDVHGVGYELETPLSTFYTLSEIGTDVMLHTHLAVREDAHLLFGFATLAERALFRNLIRVSGVGAKLALLILSGMNAENFAQCIQDGDSAALVRLPGIGKKTAERLIVEMRDRIKDIDLGPGVVTVAGNVNASAHGAADDAISALVALGYKQPDAVRMVRAVKADGLASEELIRLALQATVKNR